MSRRDVSRLLLAVLAALGLGFAIRACIGAGGEEGFVDFGGGWNVDRLRHEAFRLDRPARLAVAAAGSFETDDALAAYSWIVRRDDRRVVWQMTPANVARERGTLATIVDTLALDAGTYDAYFTTFGDPLLPIESGDSFAERVAGLLRFGNRAWESDASKWQLRLDPLDPTAFSGRRLRGDERDATPAGPDLVWAASPDGSRDNPFTFTINDQGVTRGTARDGNRATYTFTVQRPVTLRVEATGELFDGPVDYGWIDNISAGTRVWTMDEANTTPAGGSVKNRRHEGALRLAPGLYRAAFETDDAHGPGRWRANPPLDPAAWGLFLWAEDRDALVPFDPWDRLPKLVEITNVGDDALETATFTLDDSLRVWVYAEGELSGRDSRYDYAWLIRDGAGTVWEMDYDRTRHAGGERRNRVEETALTLAPGRYTLHVQTDDSHSPDRWRSDGPDHPERWGATLFALDPDAPAVAVERRTERESDAPASLPAAGTAELPIRLAPLGNGQHVRRTFTLDAPTELRIYAVGEILPSGRFDWGWITDEDGEHVWEMTRTNTEPAGGARKNREFDGIVTLPVGAYTVHFKTDDSHAFGRFNQGSPTDPSAWGITVERAAAPPPPPSPPDTTSAPPNPPLSDA